MEHGRHPPHPEPEAPPLRRAAGREVGGAFFGLEALHTERREKTQDKAIRPTF